LEGHKGRSVSVPFDRRDFLRFKVSVTRPRLYQAPSRSDHTIQGLFRTLLRTRVTILRQESTRSPYSRLQLFRAWLGS
jgi:hypothetical protein